MHRSRSILLAAVLALAPLPLAAQNLLVNGSFNSGLAPWTWDPRYVQAPGSEQFSSIDANGSGSSGSVQLRVTEEGRARQLLQCINLTVGQIYEFGARVYFPTDQTITGEGLIAYVEYKQPNCAGTFTGFGELKAIDSQQRGVWLPISARPPTAPNAASVQVIIGVALRIPGDFHANFDDVYLTQVPPSVVVSAQPNAMVQRAGEGGASTSYTLANIGEAPAAVTLTQQGSFFTQTPSSFTIPARGSQLITITAFAQSEGEQSGSSLAGGTGVPPGLAVPIRLASVSSSSGGSAKPSERRVDVAAAASVQTIDATTTYRNDTDESIVGIVTSDAPWVHTPANLITVPPHQSVPVVVQIDRSLRSEAETRAGSASAVLRFDHLSGNNARVIPWADAPAGSESQTLKDSLAVPISPDSLKPLDNSVAIFLPGVGNVQGSVGTFISDLAISASKIIGLSPDLDIFYTPASAIETLRLSKKLAPDQLLVMADVVKSYFARSGQTGTLQIRTNNPDLLSLSATVINKSNAAGTYGTAIPILRSDRAVSAGESSYLTGLVGRSNRGHTNLLLQEAGGYDSVVDISFLSAAGSVVSTAEVRLNRFAVARLDDAVPPGAVAAIMTNRIDSAGRFVAYATPVDDSLENDGTRKGGDTWVVADWPKVLGYSRFIPVVIPVAGVVRGANDQLFRTDVALMNCTDSSAVGVLAFHPQNGSVMTREVRLGAHESAIYANVIQSIFQVSDSQLGYLTFAPTSGQWSVSSRTFATTGTQVATFGTGVPAVALSSAFRKGQTRRITGFDDAGVQTVSNAAPATFRSNLGLVETTGQSVRVRVTLYNVIPEGYTALAAATVYKEYDLAAGQSRIISGISRDILGDRRSQFRQDLKDLFIDVAVVDGNGGVIAFVSSVDNGSADQVLQIP